MEPMSRMPAPDGVPSVPPAPPVPGPSGSRRPVPRLREVSREELSPGPAQLPAPLGVSIALWIALAVSAGFFWGVQIYVSSLTQPRSTHETVDEASLVTGEEAPDLEPLTLHGPEETIHGGDLWLRWDEIDEAAAYRLRIFDAEGGVIVDPAVVYGTVWNPPDGLLPALEPGRYFWEVEAVSEREVVIARSERGSFRLRL